MLYSSKSNYRKRNIGIISAIIVALFSAVYLAYAIWPPKSYFLKVFENNTGIKLENNSRIPWKWASRPYGFPKLYTERYITAVIEGNKFDSTNLPAKLVEKSDCFTDSNPVQKYLMSGAEVKCWGEPKYGRVQDNFFLLHAEKQDILFYKYRGR